MVYWIIDDLEVIEVFVRESKIGVVVGGGLLGLEVVNVLKEVGLDIYVVEFVF